GAAERGRLLTGETVAAGDVLLGLASSGLHANGFSLVRRIVEAQGLSYDAPAPFDSGRTLGEALLEPTRIYVKSCLKAVETGAVKALAHVTGGGLVENPPRVLAQGLAVEVDAAAWPLPPVFRWLKEAGRIVPHELTRTFNCGIGMAVIADADAVGKVERVLAETGETVFTLGRVVPRRAREPPFRLRGAKETWRS
ncbi:MAG: phosphoribosylformylglycinamidine cyclo-ligase, partial [Alphaproteobacteria bacterium]